MPSGRTACPHVTDNKDGTVTVKYSPTERGLHEMEIKYDGSHIPGNLSGVDRGMAKHATAGGAPPEAPPPSSLHLFCSVKLTLYVSLEQEVRSSSTSMPLTVVT